MLSRRLMTFLLLGLTGVAVISTWRMIATEAQRAHLAHTNTQLSQTVQQLQTEQSQLTQELGEARSTLDTQTGEVARLRQEWQTAQEDLTRTVTELASLKRDVHSIQTQNTQLNDQVSSAMMENQQWQVKFSSVHELKLAIRDVRRKIWHQRWAAWRAHLDAYRHVDEDQLALGNQGYVIRDGLPTLGGGSPRMHVHVLEPQAQ